MMYDGSRGVKIFPLRHEGVGMREAPGRPG